MVEFKVRWDLCEGNGVCAIEAPDVFDIDDDGNLIVLNEHPGDEQRQAVLAAARVCPKRAIEVAG